MRLSDLKSCRSTKSTSLAFKQAGVLSVVLATCAVILSGEITKAVNLKGIKATKGARAAIEAAGGSVAE